MGLDGACQAVDLQDVGRSRHPLALGKRSRQVGRTPAELGIGGQADRGVIDEEGQVAVHGFDVANRIAVVIAVDHPIRWSCALEGQEDGGVQKGIGREAAEGRGIGGAAQALDQTALEHRPADDRAEVSEDAGMAVLQIGIRDDPGLAVSRHGAERPQHAGDLPDLVVPIGIAVHEIGEVADGVETGRQSAQGVLEARRRADEGSLGLDRHGSAEVHPVVLGPERRSGLLRRPLAQLGRKPHAPLEDQLVGVWRWQAGFLEPIPDFRERRLGQGPVGHANVDDRAAPPLGPAAHRPFML